VVEYEWKWGEGPHDVLLLHGFSGGPSDLRFLGDRLAEAGFSSYALTLPGHGDDRPRLGEMRARDWQEAAREALLELRRKAGRPIHVVGFSLGGALAAHLAAHHPEDVSALVLLAPALRLSGSSRLYRNLFRIPLISKLVPAVRKGPPDLSAASLPIDRGPELLPTGAARLLDEMIHAGRAAIDRVRSPTLVFWGAQDGVVPREAAEEAARRTGARLVVLPNSRHHLALDADRQRLAREVLEFLRSATPEIRVGEEVAG